MKLFVTILTLSLVFLTACSREPKPISFGKDMCELCRMTISDHRFGAEIVTTKGRVYKFDAAECMFNFISVDNINFDEIHSIYVIDCLNPGNLIEAISAVYLISENFPSPMGANLSCYSRISDAETNLKTYGGEIKNWEEIKNMFKIK